MTKISFRQESTYGYMPADDGIIEKTRLDIHKYMYQRFKEARRISHLKYIHLRLTYAKNNLHSCI